MHADLRSFSRGYAGNDEDVVDAGWPGKAARLSGDCRRRWGTTTRERCEGS